MNEKPTISCVLNPDARKRNTPAASTRLFTPSVAQSVRRFYRGVPGYEPTPLVGLQRLAERFHVRGIWVKDESRRFTVKSFKILGVLYAVATVVADRLGMSADGLSFGDISSDAVRTRLRGSVFTAATDGNHGRALAWAARQLGCKAVIYVPKNTTRARIEAIESFGAEVSVLGGNYDDTLRAVVAQAAKHGWIHVQDQAWKGYEDIPTRTMQGYLTLLDEAFEQLGDALPTHVIVPCGAGAFAGSVQADLVERFGVQRPITAVIEPVVAACLFQSMSSPRKEPRVIGGDLDTIMAGLSCGETSTVGWPILRDYTDAFFACADEVALTGMRILGNPLEGDERIISGESGAVPMGLVAHVLGDPANEEIAAALGLTRDSRILLISTEGDTDPALYRKIVWGTDVSGPEEHTKGDVNGS